MSISNYDTWKLATEDEGKVAFLCDHCENPIYVGWDYISTNEGRVCDECYDEFAWNSMGASRQEAEEEVCYGEDD